MVAAPRLTSAIVAASGCVASVWLIPAFACAGIRESAPGIGGQPLLLEIAPEADRSLYPGVTSSLLGPVRLATMAGGVIAATLGFAVLLGITVLAHALALIAALSLRAAQRAAPPNSPVSA